ncbi:hypothetical protein SNE25_13850 [Mucilaginibacter sabulilitoris]|uniref:Uncharacterized protein n=1 Tax=Mucilaginibacter sabulilitoris TaxID=1173583 RepID=A0ABZ0TU37_9SPHI|nr:hypothetical protein [Mucilaginibacter sabulilitoris]WPU96602.1 hypothetical protein SNE25_13850 [Mucilaginibacter sabulilitoris]
MPIFMLMNNDTCLIEIPALLSKKTSKILTFKTESLVIEKPLSFMPPDFIAAENITGFRYGVNWINGYAFTIGRQYFIEIQNEQQKIISIKLTSYYNIRKKLYSKLWTDIIQQLWRNYFVNVYNYYYELYNIRQTFDLCGIRFHVNGIGWEPQNILQWNAIGISSYQSYFMIYNSNNKSQNKSRSFANDWNAVVLQALLKKIVEERKVLH